MVCPDSEGRHPIYKTPPPARYYTCSPGGVTLGRTNITVKDPELWKWAKKRAVDLELRGVSEYLFLLIEADRANEVLDTDATLKEESP